MPLANGGVAAHTYRTGEPYLCGDVQADERELLGIREGLGVQSSIAVTGPGSSGLRPGLYIARGITEAHGGTLTVESTPGLGATFTVTLPLLTRS